MLKYSDFLYFFSASAEEFCKKNLSFSKGEINFRMVLVWESDAIKSPVFYFFPMDNSSTLSNVMGLEWLVHQNWAHSNPCEN